MWLRRGLGCVQSARCPIFGQSFISLQAPRCFAVTKFKSRLTYRSAPVTCRLFSSLASSLNMTVANSPSASSNCFPIDKPRADNRLYRHITLPNKLQVMLVSDPNCERAAAAINVDVGSFCDPPELQGLAHFLEHMLFLGTAKYPDEDAYNRYLQQHGGNANAETGLEHTAYHFNVAPDALENALDMFAQFFLTPLFTESATKRELDAVNSEHCKNLLSDAQRQYQLIRHLANPAHPLSKFSTGNHKTLRDDPLAKNINVREQLLNFYHRYYSANIMRLCVLGRESLDTLERMVAHPDRFERIANKDVIVPKGEALGSPEPPFRDVDLGKLVRSVAITDMKCIVFHWVLPEQTAHWKSKPLLYIKHLLGYQGEGSLLSALKNKKLASDVGCHAYMDCGGLCLLRCYALLTDEGFKESGIQRVGQLLFDYIKLIKTTPVQGWINKELKDLTKMEFEFQSPSPPEQHVVDIADALQRFPPEHVLSGSSLIWEHDAAMTQSLLEKLTTSRMNVFLLSKSYDQESADWEKEPFYNVPYKIESLPSKLLDTWNSTASTTLAAGLQTPLPFSFPKPNAFVPSNLDCKPVPEASMCKYPQLLDSTGDNHLPIKISTYFKQVAQFRIPKALVVARLTSPFTHKGLREFLITELYLVYINQLLNEYAYDAGVAGLSYSLGCSSNLKSDGDAYGFSLLVSGYNDTVPTLLDKVCQRMNSPSVALDENLFNISKTLLLQHYNTLSDSQEPYLQTAETAYRYLRYPLHYAEEKLPILKNITFDEIQTLSTSGDLFRNIAVQLLIQGNMTSTDAEHCVTMMRNRLGSQEPEHSVSLSNDVSESKSVDATDQKKMATNWTENGVIDLSAPYKNNVTPNRLRVIKPVAHLDDENNAVTLLIQLGKLGLEDAALLCLAESYLSHPFFDCLRTQQQLGYLVGARKKSLLYCHNMVFVVQSDSTSTTEIAQRIEAFLEYYVKNAAERLQCEEYEKLRDSTVAKLSEKPDSLSEEVSRNFAEILLRTHEFDRRDKQSVYLSTVTLCQFIAFLERLYNAPWFVSEAVVQRTKPATRTATDAPNDKAQPSPLSRHCPLAPQHPQSWTTITEDPDTFKQTMGSAVFRFPAPDSCA